MNEEEKDKLKGEFENLNQKVIDARCNRELNRQRENIKRQSDNTDEWQKKQDRLHSKRYR